MKRLSFYPEDQFRQYEIKIEPFGIVNPNEDGNLDELTYTYNVNTQLNPADEYNI